MQINIVDNDVLAPVYACGKRGESIDVQVHGPYYTTWKILDDLEKHIGKRTKNACKICSGDMGAIDKFIESMQALGQAAKNVTPIFSELAKALNFNHDKDTNDQEDPEV